MAMTDEQKRSHAVSQLRAARELYSETGDRIYLSVIDAHLRTIAEVDERRRLAQERRAALLAELREKNLEQDAIDEEMERRQREERRSKLRQAIQGFEAEASEKSG
jgi:hypothetical protein